MLHSMEGLRHGEHIDKSMGVWLMFDMHVGSPLFRIFKFLISKEDSRVLPLASVLTQPHAVLYALKSPSISTGSLDDSNSSSNDFICGSAML